MFVIWRLPLLSFVSEFVNGQIDLGQITNMTAGPGADFQRDLGGPGRVSVAQGVVFRGRKARFSSVFALRARAALTLVDVHETTLKLRRNAHRSFRATTRKR